MPEPVCISVSDVRREIYRASEFAAGDGQASTETLGSLFHKTFQALMDTGSECAWMNVLDRDTLNDSARLQREIYRHIVGPYLREHQAVLQNSTSEVLTMWDAMGHLCTQVCRLLAASCERRLIQYDAAAGVWHGTDQFAVERKLRWLVEEPSWTAPVLVTGIADALWHNPASKQWGVLELKLGSGSSEADVAQLCLYHDMLEATLGEGMGRLTLWHFQPALKQTNLTAEQTAAVRGKLRALIGRIAGVTAGGAPTPAPETAHRELGKRLIAVLEQFGPMAELDSDPVVGPAFLRFHLMPGRGVKVSKILSLGEDIGVQLRLSKPALVRLEDGMLVVDLQRPDRETLLFDEFRKQLPVSPSGNPRVLVGIDLRRQPRYADLSGECPHILAAGTTGSGKSEWLRMAVSSLLATNTPETLRLMLIDPKRVSFGDLRHSPFLLDRAGQSGGELLFTAEEAIDGLRGLIELMEDRYRQFAEAGVADLDALNHSRTSGRLARVVCFCDEYGNLVAQKKNREQIEFAIHQLGAKARAAGIHLIVATQDPRAQILSPVLKNNLGGRVCLLTTSSAQSRMMLDQNGAEKLLGNGDLFFKTTGEPVRLQAPLLTDAARLELFGHGSAAAKPAAG